MLIGRAAQLDALDRRLESARGGRGQVVLIAGEAGVGKSRLLAEISADAAKQGFVRFFLYQSSSQPLLVVEDLHWSDGASLEVLLALAHRIVSQPILGV